MPGDSATLDRSQLAEISRGLVQLYRSHFGKGPTKAKTQMVEDTIVCWLEDFFTPLERTLVERGGSTAVRDMRLKFQDTMEPEFRAVVEEVTGRKVRAFMSQASVEPELAVELFLLHPLDEDDGMTDA